jgi:RNA polymerase sigma-54 factor
MRLGLETKLKQVLAPQLIQSLRMLQMPILKLEQTLRQELSTNPLLEEVDSLQETEEPELENPEEAPGEDPELSKINWEDYLGDDIDYKVKFQKDKGEEHFEAIPTVEKSLYDHLLEQLNFNKLTQEEIEIGEYIIGNIDENGYLSCSVEEIISALKSNPEKTKKTLKLIQSFDPPGVGARDLKESLLIQLEEKNLKGSLAYQIVNQHLSELDKKSPSQLSKLLKVSFEEVQKAMEIIRGLSPRPAAGRFTKGASPIVPDLIVDKIGSEYVVFHNDKNVPRLRINPTYREMIKKGSDSSPETKKYIRQKLEQARWFLNALNQRRSTMIKTMEAIVEEQKEFFEHGIEHLKPLIMETIAEKVGMNVATISRVANDKYVQTPQGMFEIRYFFTSGLKKEDGEELSKRKVKKMIEEIIRKENPSTPLSDQEIYLKLKEEGINIARRTVTKYREELKILPARFRKKAMSNKDEYSGDLKSPTPSSDAE